MKGCNTDYKLKIYRKVEEVEGGKVSKQKRI